uniref:Amidohydrolase-related domain-containing protein n=1 Tax=Globisporangium ultimum (strain ATCC 200006 / CBS 805.95 / DAOM BR144) TaxID=431595 RepID=K3WGI3_GLOUD
MDKLLQQHGRDAKATNGKAYTLLPELTWTGERFETDVCVHVGSDGFIASVTKAEKTATQAGDAIALPGHALIPGMVNAHSHAFQRGLRGLGETYPKDTQGKSSFWTWREEMYKLVGGMTQDQIYALTKQCFTEMLDAGITSVGEFHYFHHGRPEEAEDGASNRFAYDEQILKAAKDVGIRIVLLNAFYEHGGFRQAPMSESQKRFKVSSHDEYWRQMDALKPKLDASTQTLGVVAHSMRAVELKDIVELHEESVRRKLVFHIHLEEQTKEVDDCKEAHDGETPMAILLKNLKIDNKFTAVHCTWTEADLLKQFVDKKGNVCICPLTEGNLGDGFPVIASCLDRVCLGTDCNARIDMCEEMRWLEYGHRLHQSRRGVCTEATDETDLAKLLFRYATKNGAESLNLKVGEIKDGFGADFALVDINEDQLKFSNPASLLGAFIFGANGSSVVKATCVNGKWRQASSSTSKAISSDENASDSQLSKEHVAQLAAAAKLANINSDDVLELSCGLMNIESTSGNEEAVGKALENWFTSHGWKVELQKVAPQGDAAVKADRYNVYASRTGNKSPSLLFNSHMDTVPPFLPARTDGKTLYGRGSCDAKSLVAAQMIASQKLVEAGFAEDVGLLYVVSEETDHSGMKKANELGLKPKHMVVGEPTDMKMIRLQKGILKIRLSRQGAAAHSGYPHLGDSAIDPLIDVLHDLKHEQWPNSEELGATTLNIGIINGGQAANAIPEYASAMLMFRLTTNPEKIMDRVKKIVSGRVDIELYTSNSPVHLTVVEGYETDIASFNTDIPYFQFDGNAYLVGAGNITDAHCAREFIEIEDLRNLVDFYFTLGKTLIEKK